MDKLRSTKIAVLVSGLVGIPKNEVAVPARSSSLAACIAAGRAYVLAEQVSDLGSALHWFGRQKAAGGASGLTLLTEPDVAGDVARRAGLLDADIDVLLVVGATVTPVEPSPLVAPPELSAEMWRAAAVIADAGISVVDDHGRLTGEVDGLEVARVEPGAADDPESEPTIAIGVGEADRELHGYVHGHLDDLEALRRAAATVAELRLPGNSVHPLTRLARPRWLRSMLLTDPALVGLTDLEAQVPLRPSMALYDNEPAAAYSNTDRVTVVCSAGVDLDLIPEAVDYRQRIDPDSRLLLVLPRRDVELATRGVVDFVPNAQVHALEPPW